jgi:hypothetical protein
MGNPVLINEQARNRRIDSAETSLEEMKAKDALEAQNQLEAEKAAAQRKAELEDSHAAKDPKNFGLKENVAEVGKAVVGGVRDTASSVLTAPQRYVDMATGNPMGEGYKPGWSPLENANPIEKTWWGSLIRSGVHFGTLAGGVVGAVGLARKGKLGQAGKLINRVARSKAGRTIAQNHLLKGAAVGAASDLVSEYSQDANGLAVLRDRFGFIDTPLATKDSDHPLMKTLKNVTEGMGIGAVTDTIFRAIGKSRAAKGITKKPTEGDLKAVNQIEARRVAKAEAAAKEQIDINLRRATAQKLFTKGIDFNKLSPERQIAEMKKVHKADKKGLYRSWNDPLENNEARAERKIDERNDNVQTQSTEKGLVELEDEGFRGHKNKPIADPWQGSPNSTGHAWDIAKDLKKIDKDWGAEKGSTDNIITAAAAEELANNGVGKRSINEDVAKELFGDTRTKILGEQLRNQRKTWQDAFGDAYERMMEVTHGRDAGDMTPDEFLDPLVRNEPRKGPGNWSPETVIAADLIQSSLMKKLRDLAVASRELKDIADVADVDGPLKSIRDNLIVLMTETKSSRFLQEAAQESLGLTKKEMAETLLDIHSTSKQQVDMMLDLARQDPTDDFLHAVLEAFSMSNKIHNWNDFDNYMHKKLIGSTGESGVQHTGQMIKELQGVMINSILSGPKTPLRAIMGTATATFTRPMSQIMGGAIRYLGSGDSSTLKSALASANSMIQAVPESYQYFRSRLDSYWSGDINTIKSRYSEYTVADNHWELMGHWAETRGTVGEKAAYRVTNLARSANQNNFLTYSTKLMAATDDAFTMILARARAKERALQAVWQDGRIPDVTPQAMKEYETRFYNEIFDPADASINDSMLKFARGEVTLSKDITGFGKALDEMFSKQPMLKPFYLFARTGINGLELSFKHIPGLNFLVKEFNEVAWATADNLDAVRKYGIENAQDLANAKALQNGRLAIGSSVMFMASQKYLNGGLTGNGPADIQDRRVWESAGWKPRSIKLGDVWVSYESMEPFSNMLAAIADMGDNQRMMGDQWVEKGLLAHSLIIAKGLVTKTYLQGINQLVDLFGNNPKSMQKIAASLANNTVPLAGLRNELGRVITPYQRELDSGFWDSIRNRNLFMEQVAGEDELPIKYDILNGQPIKNWNPATRMFNAISPIQLNFDQSPGRQLLIQSNYPLRTTAMSSPNGISLANSPSVRSKYQKALGDQDLELQLAKLAQNPEVIESLARMEEDIRTGRHKRPPGISPMSYTHNILIQALMKRAQSRAWASIQTDPNVIALVQAQKKEDAAKYNRNKNPSLSRQQHNEAGALLNIYK